MINRLVTHYRYKANITQALFCWQRFYGLYRQMWLFISEYPQYTVFAPFIQNFLFFLVFFFALTFNDMVLRDNNGDVIANLIPGIACLIAFERSYQLISFQILGAKILGGIGDIYTSPLNPHEIILAWSLTSAVYGLCLGMGLLVLASLFMGQEMVNLPMIIINMFMGCFIIALFGFATAFYCYQWDDQSFLESFFVTPTLFFSGVFFPLTTLPSIFSDILILNPLAILIANIRTSYLGNVLDMDIFNFMLVTITVIAFYIFCTYSLKVNRYE